MFSGLLSIMFFYWFWIVLMIGGFGLLMRILRLDRPREILVSQQTIVREE